MGETHVEVVVFDGIEKAPQFLVGAFYIVKKLKDFEDDQEARNNSSNILFIEENKIYKGGNGREKDHHPNQYKKSKSIKAHTYLIYGKVMI